MPVWMVIAFRRLTRGATGSAGMELALCPAVQHSALETDYNLERVLPMAQRLGAFFAAIPPTLPAAPTPCTANTFTQKRDIRKALKLAAELGDDL